MDSDRNRSSGGLGLGLAIARRSVEVHNGRLTAQNANPGLLVTIEFPAAAHTASRRHGQIREAYSGFSILMPDGSANNRVDDLLVVHFHFVRKNLVDFLAVAVPLDGERPLDPIDTRGT